MTKRGINLFVKGSVKLAGAMVTVTEGVSAIMLNIISWKVEDIKQIRANNEKGEFKK